VKRLRWRIAGLSCALALLNCGSGSTAANAPREAQFVVLAEGAYTRTGTLTKKQAKVISTQSDYATELAVYSNMAPVSVDFATHRVLLLDMGPRRTGGHAIRIAAVDVADDWVVAHVELIKPGPSCLVTQSITNPHQFVAIPTQKELLLSEQVVVTDCAKRPLK
jgi:hypothetical protein